jgi:hypothetical protein
MNPEDIKKSNAARVSIIHKKTDSVMKLADKLERLADQLEKSGLSTIAERLEVFQGRLSEMPDQIASMQSVSDRKLNAWIKEVNKALSSIEISPSFDMAAPNIEVQSAPIDLSPISNLVSGLEQSLSKAISSISLPEQTDRTDELKEAMEAVKSSIDNLVFPVAEHPLPFKDSNGKPVQVQLDSNGNLPTTATLSGSVTASTEYTEGDTDASITGGAIMYEGAGDALTVPSSTNPLPTSQTYGSADYYPQYNRTDLGLAAPNVDPFGSLQVRGAVTTDEGTGRLNFTGSSLSRTIGTATFTTGSYTVTGTGFINTYDLHQGAAVRLSADTDADWNTVVIVNSDTELTLVAPYSGTGGTGASITQPGASITGAGGTISVASGQLTIATGTTAGSESMLYSGCFNGPIVLQGSFSVSQRIANQDFIFGYERAPFATIQQFARFRATGTTNTQIICETAYNPTGAPSAAETESTTVTIPAGDTTATLLTYKIELEGDRAIFSIGNSVSTLQVVATHTKRLPHIMESYPYGNYISLRTLNGATPPAGSTNFIFDYAFAKVFDRLEVTQTSPGDGTNSQVVQQKYALTTSDILQSAATATGNGVALSTDGMSTAVATVTGTFVGTITFEGTEDNSRWDSLNVSQAGTNTIGSTATAAGSYTINVAGYTQMRARISAYTSGSITVTAHATPHTGPARVVNANLVAGSAAIGTVGVTSVVPGVAATSLGKAEDAVHASGDTGVMALTVRRDTSAASSGTTGDYEPLSTNSTGQLWTAIGSALPAGTNNIGDVDVLTVPAPLSTTGGGTEATALRVTVASDSTGVLSVDDNGSSLTVDGTVAATQSGTWTLGANSGVDVGDVTINNASGASAVNIQDGGNSITVDGTITANAGTGTMAVSMATNTPLGTVAHDAADSGAPIKIGSKSAATLSTATLVAAADRSDLISDLDGAVITRGNSTLADVSSGNASNTDGTSTQVIAAAGAGVKTYITDVTLTNTSAGNIYVELKDGTSVKWTFPVPANSGVTHHFGTPLAGTANTAWNFDPSAATTTVYCSAAGFKSKV